MSLILPKGIVVNTAGISGDIEKIDREPLAIEEIAKLWKVYTTTKRRLLDPTAERLENYWWRIWGSRKRHLNGATVARLFADISDGRSFIPLRGPPNRDESGGRPISSLPRGSGNASTTAIHPRPGDDSFSSTQSSNVLKNPTPMPPPILKKNRGPSSTGPRPTARFISPHSSEEEDVDGISSTNSPGAHVVVRPPTPEAQSSRLGLKNEAFTVVSQENIQTPGSTDNEDIYRPDALRRFNSASIPKSPGTIAYSGRSGDLGIDLQNETDRHTESETQNQLGYREDIAGQSTLKGEALRGSRTGKPKATDTSPKIGESRMQGSSRSAFSQGFGGTYKVSSSGSEPVDDSKRARTTVDTRHAKNISAESSISLPPTDNDAGGNVDRRGRSFSASGKDDGPVGLAESKGVDRPMLEQGSLFAKRPVQPAKSASALFASSSKQTTDPLSRSKSQLTLLLEKDRASTNEKKATAEPATLNKKEAKRIV